MRDGAFYELASVVEVCFPLLGSLRRETLPSSRSVGPPPVVARGLVYSRRPALKEFTLAWGCGARVRPRAELVFFNLGARPPAYIPT